MLLQHLAWSLIADIYRERFMCERDEWRCNEIVFWYTNIERNTENNNDFYAVKKMFAVTIVILMKYSPLW